MHENQLKKHRRAKGWVCRYPNSHLVLVWIQNAFVFVNGLCFLCGFHALFTRPASTDFSKFFFKMGSHGTIHTFKNNFAIMFSVFSNKQFSNKPLVSVLYYKSLCVCLDCTENNRRVRLRFFEWVSCTVYRTRKYRFH